MATQWLFTQEPNPTVSARVTSQTLESGSSVLTLRNPWVSDSVFMAKIYTAMTVGMMITVYPDALDSKLRAIMLTGPGDVVFYLLLPLIFTPFLAY